MGGVGVAEPNIHHSRKHFSVFVRAHARYLVFSLHTGVTEPKQEA